MYHITKKSTVTDDILYYISENRWTWDVSKKKDFDTSQDAQDALDHAVGKTRAKFGYTIISD